MTYQELKAKARQKAIDWQIRLEKISLSYEELAYWSIYFTKLGKRYGLIKEFRENAII